MRSFIKVSYEVVLGIDSTGGRQSERAGKPMDIETLLNLGEERFRLSPDQRHEDFELCHKCRAEYDSKSLWDNCDFVLSIHNVLGQVSEEQRHAFETNCKFDKVYVDEVQDLTNTELALLVRAASLHRWPPHAEFRRGSRLPVRRCPLRLSRTHRTRTRQTSDIDPQLPLSYRYSRFRRRFAGVALEVLPRVLQKLPQDDGLCRGQRPVWVMPERYPDLARQKQRRRTSHSDPRRELAKAQRGSTAMCRG